MKLTGVGGSDLTIYWPAGIFEVFRNGRAGVWTDLALDEVDQVHIAHRRGTGGAATVWNLATPIAGESRERERAAAIRVAET